MSINVPRYWVQRPGNPYRGCAILRFVESAAVGRKHLVTSRLDSICMPERELAGQTASDTTSEERGLSKPEKGVQSAQDPGIAGSRIAGTPPSKYSNFLTLPDTLRLVVVVPCPLHLLVCRHSGLAVLGQSPTK
ncbi:hypothetical protein PIIN_01945 [Serendipita indica DSM 11827]|uniref:Uncharacterized protein n=1 Tax=Serendipita indica (strain DSM 11827) TaxID=1109443 RepID=G4T9V2_SERID|nr:hypothetical protein PIIN_01945 [Serendipita indica DSM 11827]